jgi:hypothetical protein
VDKDNVLDQMVTKKLIIGYIERHTENTIQFQVSMPSASMTLAEQVGIHHTFKLTTAISTSNMMLLDAQGRIKKYDSPLEFKNRIKFIRQLRSHHVCFQDQIYRLYEAAMVKTKELVALRSNTVQALWLSDLDKVVMEFRKFSSSSSTSPSDLPPSSASTVAASASSIVSSVDAQKSQTLALRGGGVPYRGKATAADVARVVAEGGNPELVFRTRELANFCVYRDPITTIRCRKMGTKTVEGNDGKRCMKHRVGDIGGSCQ